MATFEYECQHCQERFEVEHSVHEKPEIVCPRCNQAEHVRRLISRTHFTLKGSGWSRDNYKG